MSIGKKDLIICFHTAGGVGKSYSASILCQWASNINKSYIGIDIDQMSHTLSEYINLNVIQVNSIMEQGGVDLEKFDKLCIYLMEEAEDLDTFIIDLGPTELMPFISWAINSQIFNLILKDTFNTHFFVPIASDRMDATIYSLIYLINNCYINTKIVPIGIEYFGANDSLEDHVEFKYLKKYIDTILYLPKLNKLEKLSINKFKQSKERNSLSIIDQLRIDQIWYRYNMVLNQYFTKTRKEHHGKR